MALSRDWTVGRFWAEAVRDLNIENLVHGERFMLVNRAQNAVATSLPILWQMYMSRAEGTPTIVDNTAGLASLRANLAANGMIELESDATDYVDMVSLREYRTFREGSLHNKNRIICAVSGNRLFLKRGSGLADYGELLIRFVRMPSERTADADFVDIPDGSAMEICLLKEKQILRERYNLPKADDERQMRNLVQELYQSFGQMITLEDTTERVKKIY